MFTNHLNAKLLLLEVSNKYFIVVAKLIVLIILFQSFNQANQKSSIYYWFQFGSNNWDA